MTPDSLRNSNKAGFASCLLAPVLEPVLTFAPVLLVLASLLAFPALGFSATRGPSSAPTTGMEGGQRNSFGPGVESKSERKIMGGGIVDAYGNPVLPNEEEEGPRQRLRSGAYGSRPSEQPSRPLPSGPGTDAGWKFK